ncbi:MAG: hypothetical protein KC766_08365 [Myxococcales bacterium]|nr:hypothetical protein [Myxococcales bacterium]
MPGTQVMEAPEEGGEQPQGNQPRQAEPPLEPAPRLDPPRGSRLGYWIKLSLAALGALIALGVLAGVLMWEPYARKLIIAKARERGVEIDPKDISVPFSLQRARLKQTHFKLIGVDGIEGTIENLEVGLEKREPTSFDLTGVEVQVTGSATRLTVELSQWTAEHPQNYMVPMRAGNVNVRWRADKDSEPWLELTGGAVAPIPTGAAFSVENARIAGLETGKIGASWTAESASVDMAFGAADAKASPVKLRVVHTPGKQSGAYSPYAELHVSKLPLDRLKGPLDMPIPTKDVFVELDSRINFESDVMGGPINGELKASLIGYLPPKPPELDGYVFGDRTLFETKFASDGERKRLTLTETKVSAGAFKLKGSGEIERVDDHATILMKLLGNLPCADLAAAAVEKELSGLGQLGRLAGKLTKQVLKGSVGVTVAVEADSRRLAEAKVAKIIGIGCGLKPLTIPNLADFPQLGEIPLPEGLKELPKGLPSALPPPSSLPPLPSSLPQNAKDFPFPFGKSQPNGEPKKAQDAPKPEAPTR